MNEAQELPDELDELIKEYLKEVIGDESGEMLTDYVIVACTRTIDNAGQTLMVTKSGIPSYILEGMMRRVLSLMNGV